MRPVVELVENRERDAARQLGISRQKVADQEKRLQELLQYRDEYNKRLTDTTSNSMDARKLHEYQVFLSRLNQAIEQQKQVLLQAQQACEAVSQHWTERRIHARAVTKVEQRYQKQERRKVEQKEQKDMDEHALRRYHIPQEE
jgi:flagellar FliJ protein